MTATIDDISTAVWSLDDTLEKLHRISCLHGNPDIRAFADELTEDLAGIRDELDPVYTAVLTADAS